MHKCRFCGSELKTVFANLNMSPLVNDYIKEKDRYNFEVYYPLIAYACGNCKLVQTLDSNKADEIFKKDYAYFSSYSDTWLKHSKNYCDMITEKLNLTEDSYVIEIASNDGYLLQYFRDKNIPHLGIEPCASVAQVAMAKGINTSINFFGYDFAKTLSKKADLICMANVLAHVPDINDFVKGIKEILDDEGSVNIEFPHLLNLIKFNYWDTIYLEHYSYLSLIFVQKLFEAHGLKLYDVDELPTHGGSLRVYGCHSANNKISVSKNVENVLNKEKLAGLDKIEIYSEFNEKVKKSKRDILSFLNEIKNQGKSIVAYGASAKGTTVFNYCGISTDYIDYSADITPAKQNTFLPGCHIPVKNPEEISKTKPDYILITIWNFKDEAIRKLEFVKDWDCKFITLIPEPKIIK